jgi:Protein of unknown function (DUF3352)
MNINRRFSSIVSLLVFVALIVIQVTAQQQSAASTNPKKTEAQKEPAPTFDSLLAADSYEVYAEIRNVGQVIRSGNISDIIDSVTKLASPPKEFKLLVKFANAHAETLMTSRMLVAVAPARPKLPQTLLAIEFSSAEEAKKFEPQLREFLPTIMPAPTPTPSSQPASSTKGGDSTQATPVAIAKKTEVAEANATKPEPLPFVIKRAGSLVLISDTDFKINNLRPEDSKLLADDPNFQQVRDRFASEPIFLFFNVALATRNRFNVATVNESTATTRIEKAETANLPAKPDEEPTDPAGEEMTLENPSASTATPASTSTSTVVVTTTVPSAGQSTAVLVAPNQSTPDASAQFEPPPPATMMLDMSYFALLSGMVGGEPKWPDVVGVAISFDADTYVLRALLVNGPGPKASAIPFIPQFVSGPALTLGSPAILPADTELFVALSLDAPQIYEGMVKALNEQNARTERAMARNGRVNFQPEAPFADLEKRLGLKIKDDLLPMLGNEIAVSIPFKLLTGTPPPALTPTPDSTNSNQTAKDHPPTAVVLISLKDKEGARKLLPRIIDGLGIKGASALAQTERREDTEIVSYANMFSYAFIEDFLVLTIDAASTRRVVDSFLNHQTLASDNHFRNYTRWQPRQVTGQVYISPALMESFRTAANEPTALLSDKVKDFLLRMSPLAEPVTYALSNEGLGPMHELHLPKNLVLMMVAGIASEVNQSPLMANEAMARGALSIIATSEAQYRSDKGHDAYATLDQLIAEHMVQKELIENHGYKIALTVSGDKFEATAAPIEYGKTGRLSYFVDESAVVRGADHAGAPATISDKPLQ